MDTVLEVFPQLSRDHVISDLVRSGDLNETIQNAMSGKIPMAEIKNKAGSKQKSNPVDPKIQDEGKKIRKTFFRATYNFFQLIKV